jgi:outer membrane protein assembly factor BamB
VIWRRSLGAKLHAAPALAADRVYAPLEDGRVVALNVATGEPQWERKLGGPANDMLALDDRVYVGSDDNFLYCLEAPKGVVAWRWRTGGDVIGLPVIDEHRVYFVSRDNVLRGLDRHSGSQRWKRALTGRPTRGPVRVGDVLLVSGLSSKVNGFAMGDGNPAGDITVNGELSAPPYALTIDALPQVVVVARDLAKGIQMVAVRRNVEPSTNAPLAQLPNPIVFTRPGGAQPPAGAPPQPGQPGQQAPVGAQPGTQPEPPSSGTTGGSQAPGSAVPTPASPGGPPR